MSLPVSVADGVPSAGAGNLETTASEDDYYFSTAVAGKLRLEFSNCTGSLASTALHYVVSDAHTGATVRDDTPYCGDTANSIAALPAGDYVVAVSDNGRSGTYQLAMDSVSPQQFDVSLPASVSDGVPASGAGNLETRSSEDDYDFTTTSAGNLQLDFSDCVGGSPFIHHRLIETATQTVFYEGYLCSSRTVNSLPAGHYRLSVDQDGAPGTYQLGILLQP